MKSIALLAATAMMSCSFALAQEQKPAAAAAAEAPKPAAQESTKPMAEKAKPVARAARASSAGTNRARREEDARHCLGRPSNTEIIKCAEAYL
jgi:hypothetical protein